MGALWGKVTYNQRQEAWCVRGRWQGKRIYFSAYETTLGKRVCQTEHEAIQLQMIISNEIAHGIFNPSRYRKAKKLHLKKYSDAWLKEIKDDVSHGTWHGYECAMRLSVVPILGHKFLPDIGHADLKELMRSMAHLSPKTRKNRMGALHALMVDAQRDGHISQLPPWIEFSGKNAVVDPPIKYLSPEAQMRIVASIPLRHRPIFLFMMATGCRPSEARAFRKKDIDWDAGHIMFAKAFGYKGELKEVKQKKAEPFPIHTELKAVLESAPKTLSPWMFPNPDTGRHYSKEINRIWNKACDSAGVKRIGLYPAVRHSYACQLLNLGVDKGKVSRLLRHSDPRMIEKYAYYETATLEKEAGLVTRFGKWDANNDKEGGASG